MQLGKGQRPAKTRITGVYGLLARFLIVLVVATMSLTLPATMFAQQPAQTGAQATKVAKVRAGEDQTIRPFRVRVPQEALDDLRRRIAATRWPDRETVTDAMALQAPPELLGLLIDRTPTAHVHERAAHTESSAEHGSEDLRITVA